MHELNANSYSEVQTMATALDLHLMIKLNHAGRSLVFLRMPRQSCAPIPLVKTLRDEHIICSSDTIDLDFDCAFQNAPLDSVQ